MEIILMEKIHKLGGIGDVVKVKAGYARNYLLPQGKALIANKENKLFFNEKKDSIQSESLKNRKEAETFSKKLEKGEIRLIRAASESGQLYGSVSSRDISNFLKEQNLQIDKTQVILNKSLKNLTYEKIQIKLHPEVIVEMILNVARSEEEANKQKELKQAITSNEDIVAPLEKELIKTELEKETKKPDTSNQIQSKDVKDKDKNTEKSNKNKNENHKNEIKPDNEELQ